jgi:hypothetical protein
VQAIVHAGTLNLRGSIIKALRTHGTPEQAKRADKIAACSKTGQLVTPADGVPYVRLDRCGVRLCPLCAKFRMARCRRLLTDLMPKMVFPRHMVLTVKSSDCTLKRQIADLLKWFRILRRTPDWREKVKGGVYVLEVTVNHATGRWHPHLHVLYSGLFWRQRGLSECWLAITGHSPVVYISTAYAEHARYLAGYVGNTDKLKFRSPEQIAEYEAAVHGLRMLQTFGSLHGEQVSDSDFVSPPASEAIPLYRLVAAARGSHLGARRMLEILCWRYPYLRAAICWRHIDWASTEHPPPEAIDQELKRLVKYVAELRTGWQPNLGYRKKRTPCIEDSD